MIDDMRYERHETDRIRRQVEHLRDDMFGGRGHGHGHGHGGVRHDQGRFGGYDDGRSGYGVRDRLGSSPPDPPRPKEKGFKLIVTHFPSSMSDSEIFSMFIRKGEMYSCEKKSNIGYVVYKLKASADTAIQTLNGTKNGNLTLSVREAPVERDHGYDHRREPRHESSRSIPAAPPPPSGIFSRLGHGGHDDRGQGFRDNMEDRGGRFNEYDDLRNNIRSNESFDDLRNNLRSNDSFDDLRNNLRSNDSYDLRNQIRSDNFNDFNRDSRNAAYGYSDRMQNNAGMRNNDFGDDMMRNNDFGDDMRLHARMMEDEMDEMRAFNDRMDQG